LVSVRHDYQRQGIASKLIALSLEKAREVHCQCVVTTATARQSQLMFQKLGFELKRTLMHEQFRDDQNRQIFCCDDGTDCGQLFVTKINA